MVRKIRAKLILQLRAEGLTGRAIAASQSMSRKSITAVLEAADATGVSWDDVAERSEDKVYDLLFPGRGHYHSVFAQPAWEKVHRKLARVGVTLKLLQSWTRIEKPNLKISVVLAPGCLSCLEYPTDDHSIWFGYP